MKKHYDLIVVGAGYAGVGAAISAARQGMEVLLLDRNNAPGGASCGNLVVPFMKFWTVDPATQEKVYLAKGIFSELIEQLDACGEFLGEKRFSEEYVKLFFNRMLLKAGVHLLYQSYLCDAEYEGDTLKSVTVVNISGKQTFTADYFIDATGDGNLAVMTGCPFHLGRDGDHLCQPMTLCFRVANVDIEKFKEEKPAMQELYKKYQAEGKIKNCRENILTFFMPVDGVVHFNSTRIVKRDPTNVEDVTLAEIEAREQVFELFFFLRDNFESFKKADVLSTAPQIGVRESRMIEGDYLLTKDDLISCKRFEDSIAVCNYDIDIHNPEGTGTSHYYFPDGEYYTIPYRCLTPKTKKNLWVAGRCISSTHEAQASYRIMPICVCLGQAAGTAAALAKKSACGNREIDIAALQAALEAQNLKIY